MFEKWRSAERDTKTEGAPARNELDPGSPNPAEQRRISILLKVYGVLCAFSGLGSIPTVLWYFGVTLHGLATHAGAVTVGDDLMLSCGLVLLGISLLAVRSVALVVFGISLIRNKRRGAALLSYLLMAFAFVELTIEVMLQGLGLHLLSTGIQLVILIVISATVDPTLKQERDLQRRLRDMMDRDAALEGMLGRDVTGEGYIRLNFFNLFWVFTLCSFLGLILEDIWHIVLVDPGVWQDRAGILFGPFSPIYGVGAVLLTIALNRFYKRNFLVIFLVSAIIGGSFEVFAGWFLQVSFGVVSWSYSHVTLFGMPDPIATLTAGRTCTQFCCLWGVGGLLWIKFTLPRVLALINKIPWKWRYSLTVACAVLMFIDCFMTLQALDFWFKRATNTADDSPVATFYAEHFDDEYMQERFQSMSMVGNGTGRVDPKGPGDGTPTK